MSLTEAFAAALDALSASGNGERTELAATQLEVAILDRSRDHRTFRRVRAARLEELISESRSDGSKADGSPGSAVRTGHRPLRGQHRPWRRPGPGGDSTPSNPDL